MGEKYSIIYFRLVAIGCKVICGGVPVFGYIKPVKPELKVRELEFYRGIYCGLCRSMGIHTGCISRLTLSYDFAFLAAVRMVLCDVTPSFSLKRCMVHPLHKKAMCDDNEALAYCASAAAVLTECKIRDDINDEKGFGRLAAKFAHVFALRMRKKAGDNAPVAAVEDCLARLSQLEKNKCDSLDEPANIFGELLSEIVSYGLEGAEQRIAREIGRSVGRYIYVLDAADDLEEDKESDSYNPLRYSPIAAENLSIAVRLELSKLEGAVNLLDFSGKSDLEGIIKNIIYLGMPEEADRVFAGKCKDKKKGKKSI